MRNDSLLTRRNWAALAVVFPLAAQIGTAPPTAPKPTASSPVDDVRKTSELLAQIEIPMAIEPAFTFHV